jgi:protein-S-isoprenylcysteine O-methyltransferase Ste14
MTPDNVNSFVWFVWAVSWFGASAWSDRTVKRAARGRELLYRGLALTGGVLLFARPARLAPKALWRLGPDPAWLSVAITVLGLVFTWWARIHLGRLWSGRVTRKAEHHIVASGPYALVRHPIYFGVILAAFATAALRGTAFGLLGASLIAAGLYTKARLEEQFLREELGSEGYDAYARRVPMLLPMPRR